MSCRYTMQVLRHPNLDFCVTTQKSCNSRWEELVLVCGICIFCTPQAACRNLMTDHSLELCLPLFYSRWKRKCRLKLWKSAWMSPHRLSKYFPLLQNVCCTPHPYSKPVSHHLLLLQALWQLWASLCSILNNYTMTSYTLSLKTIICASHSHHLKL